MIYEFLTKVPRQFNAINSARTTGSHVKELLDSTSHHAEELPQHWSCFFLSLEANIYSKTLRKKYKTKSSWASIKNSDLLDLTTKVKATKEKIDKLDFTK